METKLIFNMHACIKNLLLLQLAKLQVLSLKKLLSNYKRIN